MLFVIILVMIYTANCEQKAEKNTEKANNNWRNCAPFAAFPDKIPSIFRRKTTMSRMCGTTESGRTDPAVRRARRLTETAVMTALLIVLQAVTKPAGQYITGTCVNAVLAVSVLAAGLWSGIAVALLSPLFAFLLGIGPQLPPIVPCGGKSGVLAAAGPAAGRRGAAPVEANCGMAIGGSGEVRSAVSAGCEAPVRGAAFAGAASRGFFHHVLLSAADNRPGRRSRRFVSVAFAPKGVKEVTGP